MAQRKRAGLITRRTLDRNQLMLSHQYHFFSIHILGRLFRSGGIVIVMIDHTDEAEVGERGFCFFHYEDGLNGGILDMG